MSTKYKLNVKNDTEQERINSEVFESALRAILLGDKEKVRNMYRTLWEMGEKDTANLYYIISHGKGILVDDK